MTSTSAGDGLERIETAVLTRVLDLHPTRVTMAELLCDLTTGATNEGEQTEVEAAVQSLTEGGLLHPVGDDGFVTPTRAAVHLGELLEVG